jgi:hypothetical protein
MKKVLVAALIIAALAIPKHVTASQELLYKIGDYNDISVVDMIPQEEKPHCGRESIFVLSAYGLVEYNGCFNVPILGGKG